MSECSTDAIAPGDMAAVPRPASSPTATDEQAVDPAVVSPTPLPLTLGSGRLGDVGEAPDIDPAGESRAASTTRGARGADVLEAVRSSLLEYLVLPEGAAAALTLWSAHTHCFDVFEITPRLAVLSPEKGCGKTLTFSILERLVANPLSTCNISTAALFRAIDRHRPTLLIDEADTFLDNRDELRGIVNAGHRAGGRVCRCQGDNHELRRFDVHAPMAIAQIGELPDTVMDRSIVVRMKRKRANEQVARLTSPRLAEFETLRGQLEKWIADSRETISSLEPSVPELLRDRAIDNWRPLCAIAETAGGEWPAMARAAARLLAESTGDDGESLPMQLLADIRSLFNELASDTIASEELVSELNEMEDREWPHYHHGRPMTASDVAALLRPFRIRPQVMRFGNATRRGYYQDDFTDTFERYLQPTPS